MFYAETSIRDGRYSLWSQRGEESGLMKLIKEMDDPRLITAKINDKDGIGKALKTFFQKKEGQEGAVSRS